MKTAMQIMLDDLLAKREVYENAKMYECVATLETSIEIAEYLIEKETEQLKDAWDAGMSEGIGTTMADLDWDGEFINYYNETFKQNK